MASDIFFGLLALGVVLWVFSAFGFWGLLLVLL